MLKAVSSLLGAARRELMAITGHPGEARSPEGGRLAYTAFARLHAEEPRLLDWVHAVPGLPGHYLITELHAPFLAHYSGFEIVLFNDRRAWYYRLPGARPGGTGHVAPGIHDVRIEAGVDGAAMNLRIEKTGLRGVRLVSLAHAAAQPGPAPLLLKRHALPFNFSVFSLELHELVRPWLCFHLQGLDTGLLDADTARRRRGLFESCRGIDEHLDIVIEKLAARLSSGGPSGAPRP